jgi:hypothetical protein
MTELTVFRVNDHGLFCSLVHSDNIHGAIEDAYPATDARFRINIFDSHILLPAKLTILWLFLAWQTVPVSLIHGLTDIRPPFFRNQLFNTLHLPIFLFT